MITKQSAELTLRDLLSQLSFAQACKLLGPGGPSLIRRGGAFEISITDEVSLNDKSFCLRFPDAAVTIDLDPGARDRLRWRCSACDGACEHAGAAFSLLLEEKTALGLAAAPIERTPVESLDEDALVAAALEERRERAREERMHVVSAEPGTLWTDYAVTSTVSGKTYRVALRGTNAGDSYCSCPDFRTNTLGTCKHILHVLAKLARRFPASAWKSPYRQKHIAIHVRYGRELELRVLAPARFANGASRLLRPVLGRPVDDVHDLLRRIGALEARGHNVTVYPDAEELIQQRLFQSRIAKLVAEIRAQPAHHPLRTSLLTTELLPYQLDGIAFAAGAGRAILADDMGLGKTIQGIGVAELLARESGIRKVLVVCPASLKAQWREEIRRFSGRDSRLVLGQAKERAQQYENGSFFTICNYEQVLRDLMAVERARWDLIILDEGQRVKNWEAKTSRVIKGLRSRFALVLTGTPIENRLEDLYSIVQFVDDRRLGPMFRFFNRHRVVDERGRVLGYKDIGGLRENLRPILLRRTREAVMKQLPPRTMDIRRIPPTAEQHKMSGAQLMIVATIIRKAYISEMDLLRLQKALLLARMSADSTYLVDKREPGFSSKIEELDTLLANLSGETGRKILLFSEWTTMLDLIEKRILLPRKLRYVRLDGSVPQKRRQQLVHEFQTDPACTLFITTNAGATGLNLQAANTVVNVDLPWNPAVLEQRIARAHRMGQRRPVQVFVLVTEDTIEERLLAVLASKRNLALAVLDPESNVSAVDMQSGIDELKARLEVLLGAKAEAPVDASASAAKLDEAERLARKERVALAGGRLLAAAFTFLGEMLPHAPAEESAQRTADLLRCSFADCIDKDESGRPRLTVTLPDARALDTLARSIAALLEQRPVAAGV